MFPLTSTKMTANQKQRSSDHLLITQDSMCPPISSIVTHYILVSSAEKAMTHLAKTDIVLARKG